VLRPLEPGRAAEVGRLIETGDVPQFTDLKGVVSCTLVDVSDERVTSLGVLMTEASAVRANELAQARAKERAAGHGAAPLEATEGTVLLRTSFPS
jgi:hypothetical protein